MHINRRDRELLSRETVSTVTASLMKIGEFYSMGKVDEYRRNAVVTVDLANKAATTFDKSRLLSLADKWLDLAYRAHRVTKPPHAPTWRASLGREDAWPPPSRRGMTTVRTTEEVTDQLVLSLRHHIQRTITYQLSALYPPIEELSPALRAKLAEMDEQLKRGTA